NQPYSEGASSLTMPGGVQVKFSGSPEAGDTFKIEPANAPEYVANGTSTTATISSPRIYDHALADSGNTFAITFTAGNTYDVEVRDQSGNVIETATNQPYVPGTENTLNLPRGMQVKISGSPVAGEVFTVQQSNQNVKTNL